MKLNIYRADASVLTARALREVLGTVEYPGDIEYLEEIESEVSEETMIYYHRALNRLSHEEVANIGRKTLAKVLTATILTLTVSESVAENDVRFFTALLEVLDEKLSKLEVGLDETGKDALRIFESIISGLYQYEQLSTLGIDLIGLELLRNITGKIDELLEREDAVVIN